MTVFVGQSLATLGLPIGHLINSFEKKLNYLKFRDIAEIEFNSFSKFGELGERVNLNSEKGINSYKLEDRKSEIKFGSFSKF